MAKLRNLIVIAVLGICFAPHLASAKTVYFNCARSGGTLVASNNWTTTHNNVTQSSSLNTCLGATSGDFNSGFYSGNSWNNDQQSTVTVNTNTLVSSAFDSVYVMVRTSGAPNSEVFYDLGIRGKTTGHASMVIYYHLSGSGNYDQTGFRIGTSSDDVTYSAGDTFSLKVVGTTLTAYQNGVQVGNSFTDSQIASGSPGVGMFSNSTGNAINTWSGTDDFSGANKVGGYTSLDNARVASITATTSTTTNVTVTPASGTATVFSMVYAGSTPCTGTTPTASGLGLTWTLIKRNDNTNSKCMGLFVGTGTPSSGKITFGAGSYSFNVSGYSIYTLTNVDSNNPVVQSAANSLSTCQSQNVAYNTTFLSGSAGVALFLFAGGSSNTILDRGGWGQDFTGSFASNYTMNTQTLFDVSDTEASSSATSAGFQCFGVAGELRAASNATSPSSSPLLNLLQGILNIINGQLILL